MRFTYRKSETIKIYSRNHCFNSVFRLPGFVTLEKLIDPMNLNEYVTKSKIISHLIDNLVPAEDVDIIFTSIYTYMTNKIHNTLSAVSSDQFCSKYFN